MKLAEIETRIQKINDHESAISNLMDPLNEALQTHLRLRADLNDPLMPFEYYRDEIPSWNGLEWFDDKVRVSREIYAGEGNYYTDEMDITYEQLAMTESEIGAMVRENHTSANLAKEMEAKNMASENDARERAEFERLHAKFGGGN